MVINILKCVKSQSWQDIGVFTYGFFLTKKKLIQITLFKTIIAMMSSVTIAEPQGWEAEWGIFCYKYHMHMK